MNSQIMPLSIDLIVNHFSWFFGEMVSSSDVHQPGYIKHADLEYYFTGSQDSLLNGIFIKSVSTVDIINKMTQICHYFNHNKVPFTCWLPQTEHSDVIASQLYSIGLRLSNPLTCIGIEMSEINFVDPLPHVTVKKVSHPDEYDLYIHILSTGFKMNEEIKSDFKKMLTTMHTADDFRHYIAYIGNDPASVITSLIKDGVMGLYCASTLVGYRNSGICTALLNHALNEGRLEHCHSCVYQSANPAIVNHVSKKFGFREYGHLLQLRYSV